jgi:hypothetical protein
MTPELMPCPFCGKQPFVDDCGRIGGGWSIRCICMHAPGVMDHRRAVAEDFWNIRASLVDSNEIRDIASELEDATAAMNWKVVRGLVTRLKAASRSSSPSSTTATPAMTLNEEPAACGYCSSADFREDDDQKFDAPAFGHRHLHSGCRNEIVMAIRATMGFEQASSSAPDYRRQVTMSESTVRDYHRLREALGVGPGVSFDHCITLVRQYVYYGKNPPDAEQIADQCRLPLRRTLSDEALRAVVRDGDKSIGESLDALNELNRRSGCALPSSRALSEEEQDRLSHIRARCVASRFNGYQWTPIDQAMLDRGYLLAIIDRLTGAPK